LEIYVEQESDLFDTDATNEDLINFIRVIGMEIDKLPTTPIEQLAD